MVKVLGLVAHLYRCALVQVCCSTGTTTRDLEGPDRPPRRAANRLAGSIAGLGTCRLIGIRNTLTVLSAALGKLWKGIKSNSPIMLFILLALKSLIYFCYPENLVMSIRISCHMRICCRLHAGRRLSSSNGRNETDGETNTWINIQAYQDAGGKKNPPT